MFGDDRVMRYMGADDVVGGSSEALIEAGQHGDFTISAHFSFFSWFYDWFWNCKTWSLFTIIIIIIIIVVVVVVINVWF